MILTKILSLFLSFCLILEQGVFAQTIDLSRYFANSGKAVIQSDKFRPLHLRYISYDGETNDFQVLLDKGDFFNQQTPKLLNSSTPKLEEATQELMKYFFIGLSLPNEKFWVNLRPDSPDNILDPDLEKTDIGRIFLEADLQLKKDTSGMTSPQTPEGKAYWDKLYKKAGELFPAAGGSAFGGGTENITIPTITRPWIVPAETIIGESPEGAYIYKATLKVMLEEDYLNQKTEELKNKRTTGLSFSDPRLKELNEYSTQLINKAIIPKLTYEVNTSKRYAPLRQVYYSLILAQWFKQKYGSLGSVRASGILPVRQAGRAPVNSYIDLIDSGNLANLASREPYNKQTYFTQYQKSFADGEYNLQEPIYTPTGQVIRRYMSGGVLVTKVTDPAIVHTERAPSIKKEYLVSSAVSSEITEKAKILADNILSPSAEKTLFIWNENVNPKIIKQTIKYINENHDRETAKYLTQELIIRIIIETAELKDENEMSQNQRELVGNIMHDAIDPLRTEQLEAHIKNYLGRIKIKDSQGREYYWDDAKKIYDTAINLEKSFIKDNSYSLLFPVFTICRILYGRSAYNKIQEALQSATSNGDDFIVKALIDELTSEENIENHNAWLMEMRNKNTKALPEEFASKEILFQRPLPFKNLQYSFETNTLYIRNPASSQENNPKDIWITSVGNFFSIDWLDENDSFKTSSYEIITVEGENKLIDRASKAIFNMPRGKISLDMLANYNEGVKRLLASSSAAQEKPSGRENHRWGTITAERGWEEFYNISPEMAEKLEKSLAKRIKNDEKPKILVIGVGRGRLPIDLLMKYGINTLNIYSLNLEDKSMLFSPEELKREIKINNEETGLTEEDYKNYIERLKEKDNSGKSKYISHDLKNGIPDFPMNFDLIIIPNEVLRYIPDCLLKVVSPLVYKTLAPNGELFAAINNVVLARNSTATSIRGVRDILNKIPGWEISPDYPAILSGPEFKGIEVDPYCRYKPFILYANKNNSPMPLEEFLFHKEQPQPSLEDYANMPIIYFKKSSSPAASDKGGIDFSRPEIITQPMSGLQSLAGGALTINPNLDFEEEWRGIQMVFNSGIRPSARRLAEFAASASASPLNSRRLEDLRGLVTDLLRRDEEDEKPAPADPGLKELLAIL